MSRSPRPLGHGRPENGDPIIAEMGPGVQDWKSNKRTMGTRPGERFAPGGTIRAKTPLSAWALPVSLHNVLPRMRLTHSPSVYEAFLMRRMDLSQRVGRLASMSISQPREQAVMRGGGRRYFEHGRLLAPTCGGADRSRLLLIVRRARDLWSEANTTFSMGLATT
ncbi:hypothetical protein IAQ61_011661, partial [Plenodomus lingam]|uniref:Predicted protein n=1 Tax=Leptosphaeria maculans (strain JN3 / isolate v23.1.3 / race Av1-4-5-6-7-8) TaxID=985895 RepID=E5AAR5_LEPMJ